MSKQRMQQLEKRINTLIAHCEQLQRENRALTIENAELIADRARLMDRHDEAAHKVEEIISRLKTMELDA